MVELRRHFHRNPELSGQEEQTCGRVSLELTRMGIPNKILPNYGVVARLQGSGKGRVIALRADMDALQIQEQTELPFCSEQSGVMHACGHDGHTAMLLGAAKVLREYAPLYNGEVRLLFQPSEENCMGARGMIGCGCLEHVDTVFGMHIALERPAGMFSITSGISTCAADRLTIRLAASEPGAGHSRAVEAGAALICALQTIASRESDPTLIFVLSCCQWNGGLSEAGDQVELVCSCRYCAPILLQTLEDTVRRLAENTCRHMGVSVQVELEHIAYPLMNTERYCALAQKSAKKLFGEECLFTRSTASVSEDFGEYLQLVDGAYATLGANDREMSLTAPNHSPKFTFCEDALYYGAALYVQYALDYLNQ